MARWRFINNPDLELTGSWEGSIGTSLPDFTIGPGSPYARLSYRIGAVGVRPGYDGPIGKAMVGCVEPGANNIAWLTGSDVTVYRDLWYTVASQVGDLGDYIWGAPRVDWPLFVLGFWSNGRASGGTYALRLFDV